MAWGGPQQSAFATFLILCPTSFFLGILFSLFPYDYPLLWTATTPNPSQFEMLESHLQYLHASPPIIPRILHIVVATGLLGFLLKLYRPSESNLLFDGASLVLYVIGLIIYLANIVKGLRVVSTGKYDVELVEGEMAVSQPGGAGGVGGEQMETLGRDDSLRVLAASNTILALVLVGVLVLQAGQWYADRKQGQEEEAMRTRREEKLEAKAEKAEARVKSPGGKKRQ